MKILELADAIFDRYTNAAEGLNLRSETNGLYPDEAPQNLDPPYLTYSFIASSQDWTQDSDLDSPLVQFSIWDDNPSPRKVYEIVDLVKALYKDVLLSLASSVSVRADIASERVFRDIDEGWQGIVEVSYLTDTVR